MTESLLLKWGTVKGWDDLSKPSQEIMRRFFNVEAAIGAMQDRPSDERRSILCELIDQFTGEIQNDWSGEMMTKEEARKYVSEYGGRPAIASTLIPQEQLPASKLPFAQRHSEEP